MKLKKEMWIVALAFSVFVTSLNGFANVTGVYRYTALGDNMSTVEGTSAPCDAKTPIDVQSQCASGTSWSDRFAQKLAQVPGQQSVIYQNLSLAGLRSQDLITNALPFIQPNVDLVTLAIGTNDIVAASTQQGAGGSYEFSYQATQKNLTVIVNTIRQKFPKAKLILINVRNLSYFDFFKPQPGISAISIRENRTILNTLFESVFSVLDVMCDFEFYDAKNYTAGADLNDAGSVLLAGKVFSVMSGREKPKAKCTPYFP